MPFVLIFAGLMLTVVAVRNNQDALYAQLQKDFTGPDSFTNWAVAVVGIGSLGYIKPIKPIIDPFIVLMIIVFFVASKNKGNALGLANLLPSLQAAFNNATSGISGGGIAQTQYSAPGVTIPNIGGLPGNVQTSGLPDNVIDYGNLGAGQLPPPFNQ